ncbi:MAG: phenylalanine--tRNA ligase subunit beta [archaeon]
MVNVDSSLANLNLYLKKPTTVNQLEDALGKMGFELEDPNPEALRIDVTADRPDMVSTAGIARAMNAYLGYSKGMPRVVAKPSEYELFVDKSVLPVRPVTATMVVKNIHLTDEKLKEIIWVQEKLHATFARDRKKATIGIYPLKKIQWPISFVGMAPEKIKFAPLGFDTPMTAQEILEKHPKGPKYAPLLHGLPVYPVFHDKKGAILSLVPITNAQNVGQVTLTDRDLFVEVSGFLWSSVSTILDILAYLFADMKGDLYQVTQRFPNEATPRVTPELGTHSLTIELDLINHTLGTDFTTAQATELLSRMMYDVVKSNPKQLVVETPAFRVDILHPLDVVDDVARAYGFDNLKPEPVKIYTDGSALPQTRFNDDLRDCVVGLGFQEVMTWHLTSHEHHFTAFERAHSPHVKLGVAKEQGLTMVRNMLYPETIRALLSNRSQPQPFRLFELDQIVDIHAPEETGTKTHFKLCLILGHASATFDEMKGNVEALARFTGDAAKFSPIEMDGFISGRTAEVSMGKMHGFIGELHPRVLSRLSIPFPVVVFECYLTH